MGTFIREIRYTLRQFWAARIFTATAILTLALGIGGTTAIFTLIHAVMLRSLPVGDPSRLYRIGDGDSCCVQPVSNTCIGNTTDGQPCNSQLQSIGFSRVHATTVAIRMRPSNRYSFLMSYSYTHAIDNFNTLNTRGPANFNQNNRPELDIGRSLNSPDHVAVLSGTYMAPAAFNVSGVLRADSGRPFNAAGLPLDSDGDGNFDDRLLGTEKGGFTTDSTVQLDLRLAKSFGGPFKITVIGEVFNVFNRRNPLTVNRTFGPTIGQTLEPRPGREGQIGFRIDF